MIFLLACYYAKGIKSGYLSTRISFLSDISKYTTRIAKNFVLLKMFKSVDGEYLSGYIYIFLLCLYSSCYLKQGMIILIILLNRRKCLSMWYTQY